MYAIRSYYEFLEFEQPIAELEAKIEALKFVGEDTELNISEELGRLRKKSETLTKSLFANLTAWQVAHVITSYSIHYTKLYE